MQKDTLQYFLYFKRLVGYRKIYINNYKDLLHFVENCKNNK